MPKDKTQSHALIVSAAFEEFSEKGFLNASIRSIGKKAGITSGGLYRHFTDKEDMFNSLVEPAVKELDRWMDIHITAGYDAMKTGNHDLMWKYDETDMFMNVIYPHKREFKLIFCCSQGTQYENYLEELINRSQKEMLEAFEYMRESEIPAAEISEDEMHMLMSAYITALIQPVMHDYSFEDAKHYIKTIEKFFMPGWHEIVGC